MIHVLNFRQFIFTFAYFVCVFGCGLCQFIAFLRSEEFIGKRQGYKE
jgi:hypothetical protein